MRKIFIAGLLLLMTHTAFAQQPKALPWACAKLNKYFWVPGYNAFLGVKCVIDSPIRK